MNIETFDFTSDLTRALLWQKNNAVNLQALVNQLQTYINENQVKFWQDYYTDIFNLDTANDFGLAVWAIILRLPLNTDADLPAFTKPIFGFGTPQQTKRKVNFNRGNFSPIEDADTLLLTVEERRLILKIRYYQLISRGSVTEVNQFFYNIGVDIRMLDGLDMTLTYVISSSYSYAFIAALQRYDILPRPAGVKVKTYVKGQSIFGFGTAQQTVRKTNFNRGNFRWLA